MQVILEITAGPALGRKIWLRSGQSVRVGRTEWSDVAIPEDPQISSVHFLLECGDQTCHIRDQNSTNGTFVNGSRKEEASLEDGDEVVVGQSTLAVSVEGRQRTAAKPVPPLPVSADAHTEETSSDGVPAPPMAPSPEAPPEEARSDEVPAPETTAEEDEAGWDAAPELLSLVNETPLEAAMMLWEDAESGARLTVILKGTFVIEPNGVARLADEQHPILTADEEDPASLVRFESDMVPFKPRADVVLVGCAYAPHGQPVTELDVRIRLGKLEKKIRVFGDRKWYFPSRFAMVPEMSQPEPFVKMDLGYDRAFGGIDPAAAFYCKENLAGIGFIGKKTKDSVHEKPLPNLEDPDDLIKSWKTRPKPVGFGFYGREWAPRLGHAGTYDEQHQKERAPAPPLDFSCALYNGAHPDLQVEGYLHGDEPVELEHLTPDGSVRFQLPGVRPRVTIARYGRWPAASGHGAGETELAIEKQSVREEDVAVTLDTLVLVPDENLLYEVFRAVCPLRGLETIDVKQIRITL